jgi:hypothetical protein
MMRVAACMIVCVSILGLVLAAGGVALAQMPTAEQQSAVKANCRSDFMANCMGVPRGGAEAFQCLKQNLAKLSPGCQQAVSAVTAAKPPAPAPALAAPAATANSTAPSADSTAPAAEPAQAPAAEKPASGWVKPDATAAAPPATSPAPAAAPSPSTTAPAPAPATAAPAPAPGKAPAPVAKTPPQNAVAAPPPTPPAPPPAAAPPPPAANYTPRERLFLLRKACAGEVRTICGGVPLGGGRVVECLRANAASLSPGCQNAMAALGQ